MFCNREDAALKLAARLVGRPWRDPLVLAIPRGGVVLGAVLARQLGAGLDVILAHKLRAPGQPELALGAISESGQVYLDPQVMDFFGDVKPYLEKETRLQLAQIRTLKKQLRGDRPPARIRGRSVIVTDDGIATGSTMIAALQILKSQHPCEIVVAVPVSSPERLEQVGQSCDQAICLLAPRSFRSVGQFYADFSQVEDEQVINLLHEFNSAVPSRDRPVPTEPT